MWGNDSYLSVSEAEQICLFDKYQIYLASIDYELDAESFSSSEPNQEELTIKREILEKMSQDAQEVLELICSNPQLVDVFCSNWGRIDIKEFTYFINDRFHWCWSRHQTRKAFREIKAALKEMIS